MAIQLYDLAPSPNNIKVRLAMGLKGIACERIPVMGDRTALIKATGQPLTPALIHDGTVIYDSSAIMRYLDANVQKLPPLFSVDRDVIKQIEGWEEKARSGLIAQGVGAMFGQALAPEQDAGEVKRAADLFNKGLAELDSHLADRPYLCGDTLTAADLTIAAWACKGFVSDEAAAASPFDLERFFHKHLVADPSLGHVAKWLKGIMVLDK